MLFIIIIFNLDIDREFLREKERNRDIWIEISYFSEKKFVKHILLPNFS